MAVIIGNATNVEFGNACVASVQWDMNPNAERLYCLGEWTASRIIYKPTITVSLSVYSPGPSYSTIASTSCANANTINCSIASAGCGGASVSINGSFWVTSYSYNKDDGSTPAQESWSLMMYDDLRLSNVVNPTYVIRVASEGSTSNQSLTGITLTGDTYDSSNGSVQANSIGRAYEMINGIVSNVGASLNTAGEDGQGNATINYMPLYI